MSTALEAIFWTAVGLILYSQLAYPLLVALLATSRDGADPAPPDTWPRVSLIVAAYAEEPVIARKVKNALELEYPRDQLEIIVACDGSPDATAERARAAGADLVLELPRGGKMRAQNAAVERATGEILAFSDANSFWEPRALAQLIAHFGDPRTGYVCGEVCFVNDGGTNQEGLYWRYEMWLRRRESRLRSVTAGNGAIYAARAAAYREIAPELGHDLSLPFNMVKRGRRALFDPTARASEKMVPDLEGELKRKRRMMSNAWPIILRGGMLSPRGYGPTYSWMIFSHRALRYFAPLLHVTALVISAALAFESTVYAVLFGAQVALVAAALAARVIPARPLLVARYYVLTTTSLALGLWDYLRHGTQAGWSPPEGTR